MPARGYLVCCLERTGSGLLADALRSTGIAGRPREYFNPKLRDKPIMQGILGELSIVAGFDKILTAGTTSNGIFGAKVHYNHLENLGLILSGNQIDLPQDPAPLGLLQWLRAQSPDPLRVDLACQLLDFWAPDLSSLHRALTLFESVLPDLRFIRLTRRNMAARAISHYRARQSGVWQLTPRKISAGVLAREHDLNLREVHDLYCLAAFQEARWDQLLEQRGIVPLRIVYEDLAANYELTVRRVLDFLGVAVAAVPAPHCLVQADATSAEWELSYRRFMAEAGVE